MRSRRDAAALLAAADSLGALAPLAATLGFTATPLPLDDDARAALGLNGLVRDARLVTGAGTLRALLVEIPADAGRAAAPPFREALARIAGRLAARSPRLLWVVFASRAGSGDVAIVTWSAHRAPPRIAALIADRQAIVDSDAETLCALEAARDGADVLVHARWLDVLGREALSRRFYQALERVVHELADSAPRRISRDDRLELALLTVSRLLFLAFLEAKGWLARDRAFLANRYDAVLAKGGHFHRRVLQPLFFGTLNTPPARRAPRARALGRIPFLNGGLFSRTPLERRCGDVVFPDDGLGRVFGELLSRFRFTAREDRSTWSEAAIDPEMLGRAFESLMASRDRRASGAFYTPQALVERATTAALASALTEARVPPDVADALLRGQAAGQPDGAITAARTTLGTLRILDPACGSGAFLVHALERVACLVRQCGDARPLHEVRREVLERSIFGVDRNPTAVWLCELRLWLSMVIESGESDPLRVPPLPNLDHHIRVGDALAGRAFPPVPPDGDAPRGGCEVAALRARYARASGAGKHLLARRLDRLERGHALAALDAALAALTSARRDLLLAVRGRDLFGARRTPAASERSALLDLRARARELRAQRRALARGGALPFSFSGHFADAAAAGGFDVVIGNPPWVRLHRIPIAEREALRRDYQAYRHAAWESGAAGARAGKGFAAQVDVAALFAERSLALLRPGGTIALFLPAKLWCSLAGGGVRRLLRGDATLLSLDDWSESPSAFDAVVYPSLLVARRGQDSSGTGPPVAVTVHRRRGAVGWDTPAGHLPFDASPGSPWLVVPPGVRAAFQRLVSAGPALSQAGIGQPMLGVKCGCNAAFLVDESGGANDSDVAAIASGEASGHVERRLLRPALRGDAIRAWRASPGSARIIWTHDHTDRPMASLPPLAAGWFAGWRATLAARTDLRGRGAWWALFRTGAAGAASPRVVWSDFGTRPRAAILDAGDPAVPINTCYVVRCREPDDAIALAALLNSPLVAGWLNAVAEPARGGYRRYLGWTVALLPVPHDWARARRLLVPLARRALAGDPPGDVELLATVNLAYRVRPGDVEPLVSWMFRS